MTKTTAQLVADEDSILEAHSRRERLRARWVLAEYAGRARRSKSERKRKGLKKAYAFARKAKRS